MAVLAAHTRPLAGCGKGVLGALRTNSDSRKHWERRWVDHSREASWGPHEILAHLGEMLPYWLGEMERILPAADGTSAFGRAPTDDRRLAVIERERTLPLPELVERVQADVERWRRRWAELDTSSRERAGNHVALGPLTVTDIATRFVVGHLEDHLDQLAAAVGGDPLHP